MFEYYTQSGNSIDLIKIILIFVDNVCKIDFVLQQRGVTNLEINLNTYFIILILLF